MSAFGNLTQKSKKQDDNDHPEQIIRPLKWQVPSFEDQYGKNVAIVGQPMVGKTNLAMLIGYFNSEFKPQMREKGYERVIQVMDAGLLPEIEHIMVLESENNLLKALTAGVEKALFRPLINKGIIEVAPIPIPRKEVILTEDNKIISTRRELIMQLKQQFDETVRAVVSDEPASTLFIIDSMSAYKKLLDDKFGLLYEVLSKRDNAVFDGVDTYRQSYYASRNTWWDNLMQAKRGFKGWNVDTYKETETPAHWLQPGEDPFRIKWVGGTEHHLDMVFRVSKDSGSGKRTIEVLNGRYMPDDFDDHEFPYPLGSRMGAMPLIDSMCEKLLLGEL